MTRRPLPFNVTVRDQASATLRRVAEAVEAFEGVRGEVAAHDGHDPVNRPAHYTSHPSGVECIEITEHLNFCIGNAIKYLWRAGLKGNAIEDLRKAAFYIDREITRVGGLA